MQVGTPPVPVKLIADTGSTTLFVNMAVYSTPGGGERLAGCQTLDGSFSAVWTATIARKDAFCSIFRDLQDLHSFPPLRTQNFSKSFVNFWLFSKLFTKFSFFSFVGNFLMKGKNILPRNSRNVQKFSEKTEKMLICRTKILMFHDV